MFAKVQSPISSKLHSRFYSNLAVRNICYFDLFANFWNTLIPLKLCIISDSRNRVELPQKKNTLAAFINFKKICFTIYRVLQLSSQLDNIQTIKIIFQIKHPAVADLGIYRGGDSSC